ncbi:hypothetical protein A2713_02285 [candidate division WWE3 bacterium RIFCSPHIGHO2_01_FULL_35_17]|uniref:Uncharacterized protein n=1 Tax=candidate division WWE3 bacterium RIFCSPHIGHO2_01_FULL_35_17 TaxID=1802614 RepID=A0A1F4UP14_UNCKA|nr:MAG: hypothetical protein A2713_02285 [candidate division WWE3 bacterium RIFCSPHIGHO2_01_FULL_35_17]
MSECPPWAISLDDLPILGHATREVRIASDGHWEYVSHPDMFTLDCDERIKLDLHKCVAVISIPDENGDSWSAYFQNGQLYVVHTTDVPNETKPFDIAQESRPWVVCLRVTAESGLCISGVQAN